MRKIYEKKYCRKNIVKVRGGIGDITKADVNTRIQDNLYLAVNSEWQKDAKIPADRSEIGINTILFLICELKSA